MGGSKDPLAGGSQRLPARRGPFGPRLNPESATRWKLDADRGGSYEDRAPHRRRPHPRVTGSRPPSLVAARGEGHICPRGGGGGCGLCLQSGVDAPRGDYLRHRLVGGVPSLLSAVASQVGGATDEEVRKDLPGDEIVAAPTFDATRAIIVEAPPEAVWPWIAQIGFGRAGWYSYDLLDNLGRHSLERIDPPCRTSGSGTWCPWARAVLGSG